MRYYKVTVNGNLYDVSVEEAGGATEVRCVQVGAQAAAPEQKQAPAPAPAPAAPAPQAQKAVPADVAVNAEDIAAPLPGTVISVDVSVGDQVKSGQLLLKFEAMKMENEIVAPRAGTIAKIHVAKGDVLESGQPVISIA